MAVSCSILLPDTTDRFLRCRKIECVKNASSWGFCSFAFFSLCGASHRVSKVGRGSKTEPKHLPNTTMPTKP